MTTKANAVSETRSVPFFNYRALFASQKETVLATIEDVLSRGAFILQKDLETFEQKLAGYLGVRHAVGLANCTDALLIALHAAGIRPGDEVILSSHTFAATAGAVHFAGGIPVPVDCGDDHLMDPASARKAVTSKTRFLMPVQLNGRTCDMDALGRVAREHGLIIIEDSAQALGSRFKGKPAGSFGLAGTFSFYPAKTLGCFGDGGALVTSDDKIAETVKLMRDHGRDAHGDIVRWGLNSRLDNLQAAILNLKFQTYEADLEYRRRLAALYERELGGVQELSLPPAPDSDADHFDIFQNYEIEAARRDELKNYLNDCGVRTIIQWGGKAVHQHVGANGRSPLLSFHATLARTELVMARSLLLPMNTMVSEEDVIYVCENIRRFYGR